MGRCKGSHWIGNQRIPESHEFEQEFSSTSKEEKETIKKLLESKVKLTNEEKIILYLLKQKG
ncbi:MAG TPA: hypothetical protein VMX17_16110 [Candidatus Glassbacteria bacterium]|nr:hypothetical protein [Candidatus Glassbacteria bacterium]